MNHFLRTSKAGHSKPHSHVIYVDEVRGQIHCGKVNDHVHEFTKDEVTGQWVTLPDPFDGHVHTAVEEIQPKFKTEKQTDEEVVGDVFALFGAWSEAEARSIERGKESEDFYSGDQWDDELKRTLEGDKRACLTINFTEKYVDDICGLQRKNSQQMTYFPTEEGDQRVADLYNILAKIILEKCNYRTERAAVFEDLTIVGRAAFNMFLDVSRNLQGDIVVERFPWDQVVVGPHEKADGSDCEGFVKYRYLSLGQAKRLYPKLKRKFEDCYQRHLDPATRTTATHVQHARDQYGQSTNSHAADMPSMVGSQAVVDVARKELMQMECWRKVYEQGWVIVDEEAQLFLNAAGWNAKDLEQVKTLLPEQLVVIEAPQQKIRITRAIGDVLVSDENPATELPREEFYTIVGHAKRKRGKFWGKVHSAKDPQREINKRSSQSIDVVNRMAAYGYFYDDSTFRDDAEAKKFERNSAIPGFTQHVQDVDRPPRKEEGVKFPAEIANMTSMAADQLRMLMSIAADQAGANTSAAAIAQAESGKLVGNEYLFDALTLMEIRVYRLLPGMIRKYYSADRIYRMVANRAAKQPVTIGGQQVNPEDEQMKANIMALLETDDFEDYDVQPGLGGVWTPTMRMAILQSLTDLVSKGYPVPPELLAKFLDMPEDVRAEMVQSIQAQQAAQAQTAQNTQETEVVKSLIGQGQIPPMVAEKYGLQAQTPPAQPAAPDQPPGAAPYLQGIASVN